MMISLSFFPVVSTSDQLTDLLSRAAWFLADSAVERIHMPVSSRALTDVPWRVAPGMDATIEGKFGRLRSKLQFVVATAEADLQPCMSEASIILRWEKDAAPPFVSPQKLAEWQKGKKVFQVDPVAIRQEGSFYIEAGLHAVKDRDRLIGENRRKFEAMSARLGRFERAYLMATGPSVAGYRDFAYEGALSIVCNSVILDEALMDHVRPQILVFADPIFHFGPSQYAAAFREKLRRSAARHRFTICIPFKYYPLFVSAMPDLRDRTIAVPFEEEREFNFDLARNFKLKTTANILTFLMVPLAATFADELGIIGCDGRPLSENTYFWNHNPNTQINDKMANIRQVHPGFFAIDYDDYYSEHCATLENQLRACEAAGKRVGSLGFSHIPALRSRSARGRRSDWSAGPEGGRRRAVIIDPDGIDWSGHFMAYNEKLSQGLAGEGYEVQVLCNRKISGAIAESRPNFFPLLDTHSWSVGRAEAPDRAIELWTAELLDAARRMELAGEGALLYLYTGSVEHAMGLTALTQRYPFLYVHVNLFFLSFRDLSDRQWQERWRPFFAWLDKAGPRFIATAPTAEIQSDLLDIFGVILDVAPHPSTGVADEQLSAPRPARASAERLHIVLPGALRVEKGYAESVECVRMLGSETRVRCSLRHSATAGTPARLRKPPEDLPENATLLTGTMSNEEFDAFLGAGDIVVLPYSAESFGKRTSGLLIDALHHGLPAVVVEGTWLAALVRRYDCGVVVPDASAQSLHRGVLAAVADHATLRQKVAAAAQDYFRRNSWADLARFILRPLKLEGTPARVLLIDLTGLDGVSATGRVKEALFHCWPARQCLLAHLETSEGLMRLTLGDGRVVSPPAQPDVLMQHVADFDPDVVYYRAVDEAVVQAFARMATDRLSKPLVVHLMDDWPERLRLMEPERHAASQSQLSELLVQARARLSVSDPMSAAFSIRYRVPFRTFANAIDPAAFAPHAERSAGGKEFRILYIGSLTDDMTFDSVKRVADVLAALAPTNVRPAVLEIHTRRAWFDEAGRTFAGNPCVRVMNPVAAEDYNALLQGADALLIAYNFDVTSVAYAGHSMANKMPEYMASGVPILAVGPRGMATIDYLATHDAAIIVDEPGSAGLRAKLGLLLSSAAARESVAGKARRRAFEHHNVWREFPAFRDALLCAASDAMHAPSCLLGPFSRDMSAHWDETNCLARLFSGALQGGVMIDVGAHHGSALKPFAAKGWTVFAFEPDEKNRRVLVENLAKHAIAGSVRLDHRAVSNESRKELPFYRSEQSTGISGLSAFHESHEQHQVVDTVTLREALAGQPIDCIDFLKIDTEGHDLRVLQGFPWDRFRPQVIECEFEDSKTLSLGYDFHELAQYLTGKGYAVYVSEWHPVKRYGITHDWHRLLAYPCRLADERAWGNLIAFRERIDPATLVDAVCGVMRFGKAKTVRASAALRSTGIEAGAGLEPIASDVWRLESTGGAAHWRAVFKSAMGFEQRTLVGALRLRISRPARLRVTLGRYGETPDEGEAIIVDMVPSVERMVTLRSRFRRMHHAVALQIEVLDPEKSQGAELRVGAMDLHESVDSVCRRLPATQLNLAEANRLFREGEYVTAMGIYLLLARQRQLRIYPDNALACARRLGMSPVTSADELLERLG